MEGGCAYQLVSNRGGGCCRVRGANALRPSVPPGGAMEAEVGEARRRPIWLEAAPPGRALTAWPRPWGGPAWSALKVPVPSGGESG